MYIYIYIYIYVFVYLIIHIGSNRNFFAQTWSEFCSEDRFVACTAVLFSSSSTTTTTTTTTINTTIVIITMSITINISTTIIIIWQNLFQVQVLPKRFEQELVRPDLSGSAV